MNKEKMKFWVTCPKCKQKFGIGPEIVMKYLDRMLNEIENQLKERKEKSQENTKTE